MRLPLILCMLPLPALAEAPRVVTDIPPVHGLVARVMDGVSEPSLILDRPGSAHDLALRPSQARALEEADLVIWIGESLSPSFGRSLEALAPNAATLELLELEGTEVLPYRDADDFAMGKDHDDHAEHDDHADHEGHQGHDDHQEHADHAGHDDHAEHDDHAKHDDHAEHEDHSEHADHDDHAGHDDHAHGDEDPHAWLSPTNAALWLEVIAAELARQDPDNAAAYRQNAQDGAREIAQAAAALKTALGDLHDTRFLVGHDGYRYMEEAIGLTVVGAISDSHAREAGPAELAALRDLLADTPVACVITDPTTPLQRLSAIASDLPPLAAIDPLGQEIPFGPGHYVAHLDSIAAALKTCLEG